MYRTCLDKWLSLFGLGLFAGSCKNFWATVLSEMNGLKEVVDWCISGVVTDSEYSDFATGGLSVGTQQKNGMVCEVVARSFALLALSMN